MTAVYCATVNVLYIIVVSSDYFTPSYDRAKCTEYLQYTLVSALILLYCYQQHFDQYMQVYIYSYSCMYNNDNNKSAPCRIIVVEFIFSVCSWSRRVTSMANPLRKCLIILCSKTNSLRRYKCLFSKAFVFIFGKK